MARQLKCDHCGIAVDTAKCIGHFPSGWLTVILRLEDGPDMERDYCSRHCEIDAALQATGGKFIKTATRGRKKTLQALPAATATKASCTHHWVIEPPNGAISVGKCRMCGERREFRNSYEYSSWYGTKNADSKPAEAKK